MVGNGSMFSVFCGWWCAALVIFGGAGAFPNPNVLMVITDDQGWGDVGVHGNASLRTPHLDQIARSGVSLKHFYVSPVCSPTRASLMTGRYALRTGVHGVTRGQETMRSGEYTLAEAFRDNGYVTGCFGKWHNGAHFPHNPAGQGFDRFVGFCSGHWNNYFDTELEMDGVMVRRNGFIADVITEEAIQFMQRHSEAGQPFFAYVSLNTPHSPWQVPDAYHERFSESGLDRETACAYAMVEHLDHAVGRLLDTLKRINIASNTLVIFMTDNGPNTNRFNGGLRGRKGSVHEGGVRVPCFVWWPGHIHGGDLLDPLAAHLDWMPTLASLCQLRIHPTIRASWDGLDLSSLLLNRQVAWTDRAIHFKWGGAPTSLRGLAVRTHRWRAVCDGTSWQLFDMISDPAESTSCHARFPDILEQLVIRSENWLSQVIEPGFSPIPTEIGHTQYAGGQVELPGHEALLHPAAGQGIRYHGDHGWANDWVDGWTHPGSWPKWPIRVVRPGPYRIRLRCSIPESSLGTTLHVETSNTRLSKKIDVFFDGPQIPGPDRVERKEVHERQWLDWDIGVIQLESDNHFIRLRSDPWKSGEIIDVKSVWLVPEPL